MKYKKAIDVLPVELVNTIQDYIQGEYLYIPRREKKTKNKNTDYQRELQKRDANIYLKVLEGTTKKELAEKYNLSQSSIRRIVLAQRKGYVVMQEKIKLLLQLIILLSSQENQSLHIHLLYDSNHRMFLLHKRLVLLQVAYMRNQNRHLIQSELNLQVHLQD